ncbi:hypothetical protein DSM104440_01544 [Usitatibacter palustris]|uniref:HTH tetR-type domain-containing protein n=1 Tax=Usitatibacter palustris TaxID=2732487 RepID=A0A6M4H8N2_9PROT|nr:hypothetical protein DSM104440_01544 [Usitatibacter palustris]
MDTPLDARRVRNPGQTREKILDAAQVLILDHGFSATTVDAVVGRAGITKGAFFHHFPSKSDLGRALVERHAATDREHFLAQLARAEKLAADPLQQVLLLIGFYEEEFDAMEEPYPGCLFASYIYEHKLFDDGTLEILKDAALFWRAQMKAKLEQVMAAYPPNRAVELDSLSDLFYSITEGAFVMTKTLGDKTMLSRQTKHLRTYLELLFAK